MPTFILFKDGVEVERLEGADEAKIKNLVTQFVDGKNIPSLSIIDNMEQFTDFKEKNKVCIIDAFATWCPPCVKIAPIFKTMSGEFTNLCAFGKFDVD
jgi:thiol-disulfide isomerase/thioredoxin